MAWWDKSPTDLAGYDPTRDADGFVWDGAAARKAVEFFPNYLVHAKGKLANQPYELNPWERNVTATIFGWKRKDGTRRYREVFVAVPRKNNKTTWCAGLALYLLFCDGEEGAEIYCAACDREQATMVFDPAAKMVRKSIPLAKRGKVLDTTKRIVFQETGSFMRAIPADAAGSHGFNAHAIIVDEMHTQPSRELYDVLKTSTVSRRQPLLVSITTAGHDRTSICYEVWDYARQVRNGTAQDPHFLPVIYEAAQDADWTDPAVWEAVNPNFDRSVPLEYLREAYGRATRTPAFENTFRNLHLNQWTDAESRWIRSDDWSKAYDEWPDLSGVPCYLGLDLASTDDLTALVQVIPHEGKLYVRSNIYCPEDTVTHAGKRFQSQYRQWVSDGWLTTTPGSATDYGFVRAEMLRINETNRVLSVSADPWQAIDTLNWCENEGLTALKVSQTYAGLWPGVKAVEEAVLEGSLVHDGSPVMAWMLDCTIVSLDANGNKKPNKRKSHGDSGTKGKIDGIVAMVMACGEAVQTENRMAPGVF